MKKIFFLLSALFILASCNKWKGEKYSDLTYYSVDFKEKDITILGFNSNDIDAAVLIIAGTARSMGVEVDL